MYRGRCGSGAARAGILGQPTTEARGKVAGTVVGGTVVGGTVVTPEVVAEVLPRWPPSPSHAASTAATTSATGTSLERGITPSCQSIAFRAVARRLPVCVWRPSAELVVALDGRLGEPLDAYVNGSQVWLRDDGPSDITLEWRLHPVAGYRRPAGLGTYEVFDAMAAALADGRPPPAAVESVWDGLECFPAFDDEVEPAILAAHCATTLGLAPDGSGLVDHQQVGDEWERTGRTTSIVGALLAQLAG
ncbi:MAG: hypothetical protein ACRD0Q_05005 [Acidimicrobiales bacterium]